jgi:hypothetical protein
VIGGNVVRQIMHSWIFENSYFVNEKILPCIKISNKRIEVKFYYILEAYIFFLSLKYH